MEQKVDFMRWNVLQVLLFSYILNPFFTAVGYRTEQKVYYLALAVIVFLNIKKLPLSGLKNLRIKNVLILLCIWAAVFISVPFVHGSMDFTYIRSFRTIAGRLAAYAAVIVLLHKKKGNFFKDFCDVWIAAHTFYVCMTAVIILLPSYRQWIKANVFMKAVPGSSEAGHIASMMELPSSFTRIGYDGFAIYGTGLKISIAFALSVYLLYKSGFHKGYLFTTAVLFAGGIFYTRTGVLTNMLIILVFAGNWFYRRYLKKYIKIMAAGILFAVFGLILFLRYLPQESLTWIFAMLLDEHTKQMYSLGGEGSFFSTHIFLPRIDTFLIGDGYFQKYEGILYGHTDSGLMVKIIYHGFPILIFLYASMIYMVFSIKKYGGKNEKLLSYALLIILAVFEVKGEAVMNVLPLYAVFQVLYLKQSSGMTAGAEIQSCSGTHRQYGGIQQT